MNKFPCPKCGTERLSEHANCLNASCGWTADKLMGKAPAKRSSPLGERGLELVRLDYLTWAIFLTALHVPGLLLAIITYHSGVGSHTIPLATFLITFVAGIPIAFVLSLVEVCLINLVLMLVRTGPIVYVKER